MNSFYWTRNIERQQFFNGQRLFSDDLQGLEAFNRELRWLHNKSLHQPGIGNGFAVIGKRGDRQVTVKPGYAIDIEGREIVLLQDRIEPIPPVAGEEGRPVLFDLTISYPTDNDLEEVEKREGLCGTSGVVRLREEPIFCWVRLKENGLPDEPQLAEQIRNNVQIVLARASVRDCQLHTDISVASRLNARPARQPFISCGQDPLIQWDILLDDELITIVELETIINEATYNPIIFPWRLQHTINTKSSGFLTTPCYTVRIGGTRIHKYINVEMNDSYPFLIEPIIDIAQDNDIDRDKRPKPNEFTITVALLFQWLVSTVQVNSFSNYEVKDVINFINKEFLFDWKAIWMGVEG